MQKVTDLYEKSCDVAYHENTCDYSWPDQCVLSVDHVVEESTVYDVIEGKECGRRAYRKELHRYEEA